MVRLKGFAIAGLAIGLSGCTALEQRETQAWLALHAVDTAQTLRIADDARCFQESDSITREIIGAHPSTGQVLAWSVGSAAVHVGVTELLLRNDHPKLAKAWQYVRIGVTASSVEQNYSIGIRIGSPNKRPRGAGSCTQRVEDVVNPIIEIP